MFGCCCLVCCGRADLNLDDGAVFLYGCALAAMETALDLLAASMQQL